MASLSRSRWEGERSLGESGLRELQQRRTWDGSRVGQRFEPPSGAGCHLVRFPNPLRESGGTLSSCHPPTQPPTQQTSTRFGSHHKSCERKAECDPDGESKDKTNLDWGGPHPHADLVKYIFIG